MASNSDSGIPPFFMFGFERSGTTLLSMMMGAHPRLAVPLSTTGLWYRYAQRLPEYLPLEDRANLERLIDDLLDEKRIRLWDASFSREQVLADFAPRDLAGVVARFHGLYARYHGKPHWGSIDIATLTHMDIANRWFPDARFIHIVRDGRDVALSHETYVYGAATTLDCAEKWDRMVRMNLKMGAMIAPERYKRIRYEDLVLDSERVLRELCDFIGVDYSPRMLEYHRGVDKKVPETHRFLWPALNKPPVKDKVLGWKARMSASKRIVFEGIAGDLLRELGYESYPTVPKSVGGYAYELWCFLGRGGRIRRFMARLPRKHPSR